MGNRLPSWLLPALILLALLTVGLGWWNVLHLSLRQPVPGYDFPVEHRYDGGISCYTFREQITCLRNDQTKEF